MRNYVAAAAIGVFLAGLVITAFLFTVAPVQLLIALAFAGLALGVAAAALPS